MKKSIWILNHYATNQFINKSGRHFELAHKFNDSYKVTVFMASTVHNSEINYYNTSSYFTRQSREGIEEIYLNTRSYIGNGLSRIKNMFDFYFNLLKFVSKREYGTKPDIIIASSVHPLTLLAGQKIAKKLNIKCIIEIRDLWPESLIAYNIIKEKSLISHILYKLEKKIYKEADKIVMTWPGGIKYIRERGWSNQITESKIHHIPNGVNLQRFEYNYSNYDYKLIFPEKFNVTYCGSIRAVNDIDFIVSLAENLKQNTGIHFNIFGTGEDLEALKIKSKNLENITFYGFVANKYIPAILRNSDVNLLHNQSTRLDKYGQSQNKMYEYIAAGKCIVQTYPTYNNVIDENRIGIVIENQSLESLEKKVLKLFYNEDLMKLYESNNKNIKSKFDYSTLSAKYKIIIDDLIRS